VINAHSLHVTKLLSDCRERQQGQIYTLLYSALSS